MHIISKEMLMHMDLDGLPSSKHVFLKSDSLCLLALSPFCTLINVSSKYELSLFDVLTSCCSLCFIFSHGMSSI